MPPVLMIEFIRHTPRMAPIIECVLETGMPKYHVPRFHSSADSNSEKTIENPMGEPTSVTNCTGNKLMMAKATAPVETSTPMKFQMPDQITAIHGGRLRV